MCTIRRGPRKLARPKNRINNAIRARQVRLLDENGENKGVVDTKEAMRMAEKASLDLVEIASKAQPPVARITDYGKWQYEENKKRKEWAAQDKEKGAKKKEEVKQTQIKPGTGGDMLEHRAKKIREWLDEGYKVHIDLFLSGRYKTMEEAIHKERLSSFLKIIPGEYHMIEEIKKSPKGYSVRLQAHKK